jgi:parallel beta-helix repeat protein
MLEFGMSGLGLEHSTPRDIIEMDVVIDFLNWDSSFEVQLYTSEALCRIRLSWDGTIALRDPGTRGWIGVGTYTRGIPLVLSIDYDAEGDWRFSLDSSELYSGPSGGGYLQMFRVRLSDAGDPWEEFESRAGVDNIRVWGDYKLPDLIDLEIEGPNEVRDKWAARYSAAAHYDDGSTADVTNLATWSVEPNVYATIDDGGLLRTEDVVEDQSITVHASYIEREFSTDAEKGVLVYQPLTLQVPADFNSIQSAIDAARDFDQVVVTPGTYTGPGNRDISFLGKAITVRSRDPNDPNIVAATIIDCNGSLGDEHRGFNFRAKEDANSVLSGLTITNGHSRSGSAIYCPYSSPTITKCIVRGNWAEAGTVRCDRGKIVACTISDNTGGGIICNRGDLTVIDCNISNNEDGPGILADQSSLAVYNSIINANYNPGWPRDGGGVSYRGYRSESLLTLANCLISGNSGGSLGGGVFCENVGEAQIANCTIVDNFANRGGGVYLGGSMSASVWISGCILWDHTYWADEILVSASSGNDLSVSYSDIQGGWQGEGNIDADPCFVQPPYWDWDWGWVEGDYRLLAGSPCINKGDPSRTAKANETDLDGKDRIICWRVDMGAYEHDPERPSIAVYPHTLSYVKYEEEAIQTLAIRNCGPGTLEWEIFWDCNWVNVCPPNGVSGGETCEVSVSVDCNGLAAGHYGCILQVTDLSGLEDPVPVEISLFVPRVRHVPGEYETIQAAIDDANDSDIVILSPGRYTGEGNRNIWFKGKAITVRSINPTAPEVVASTIIDCNGTTAPAVSSVNEANKPPGIDRRIGFIFDNNETSDSVVAGLTITNCQADWWARYVAAILCDGSSPTVTNCSIIDNWTRGIFCQDAAPTISNCTISRNYGWGYHYEGVGGGGVFCIDSDPLIVNCVVSGNQAVGSSAGGGIFCARSSPTITNCTVMGNLARYGGAIACVGESHPQISNSILWANSAYWGTQIALLAYRAGIPPWWPRPEPATCSIHYSDIQEGQEQVYISSACERCNVVWDAGNMDAEPLFVDPGCWGHADDPNVQVEPNDPNAVWVEGDYHLLPDSPCVDSGSPYNFWEPDDTDRDGRPRVADGDNDGNSVVDMGAYEFFFNVAPVAVAGPNQTVYAGCGGTTEVVLDGNDCYDDDGDELSYYWNWTIDGNSCEANGVNPTIELPVGEHVIRLVVHDGTEDSEPDECIITAIGPVQAQVGILPRVIDRHSRAKRIIAFMLLPEGITKDQLSSDKFVLYPGVIEAEHQMILPRSPRRTGRTMVICFFERNALLAAVPDDGRAQLRLSGSLNDGRHCCGSGSVWIRNRGRPGRFWRSLFWPR